MCLTFLRTRYSSLFVQELFKTQPTTAHSQTLNRYLARYFGGRYLNISTFLSCNEKSQVIHTPLRILLSERRRFARDISLNVCLSRRQVLLMQGKKKQWFSSLLCFRKDETQLFFVFFFLLFVLQQCNYCFGTEAASTRVRGEVTLD